LTIPYNRDILKAHGGEIKVERKEGEGEGSEFIVWLPLFIRRCKIAD
jgi:signal transduction histidine kinase